MEELNFFQPILMLILILFSALGLVGCGQAPKPETLARLAAGKAGKVATSTPTSDVGGTSSASYTYVSCTGDCHDANGACMDTCTSTTSCTTGRHTFTSIPEECTALQSESLNKACNQDDRRVKFQTYGCTGTYTATN